MKLPILITIFILFLNVQILPAQPQLPFTAYSGNPILTKGTGWDQGAVALPKIIILDNLYYLFYAGTTQPFTVPFSMGVATSGTTYPPFMKNPSNPILAGDGTGFDSSGVASGAMLMEGDSLIIYYPGLSTYEVGRAAAVYPFENYVRKDIPVLTRGSAGEWDSGYISAQSIIKTSGGYFLFYSGGMSPPPGGVTTMQVGLATSSNGIHWTKYNDPATSNSPYAESDPVVQPGLAGSWDQDFVWLPSVLKTGELFEMFYHGGSPAGFGYAVSQDGISWTKNVANNPIFVTGDDPYTVSSGGIIQGPSVILKDSIYYMYYDYGLSVGEIGLAMAKRLPSIIHVPEDYPSIQEGINAAIEGDTILVEEGTYYENISFQGKAITVASLFLVDGDTNHINNTIIDGSQPSHPDTGSVVRFVSGEDTNSVLTGFTLTGGTGTEVNYPPVGNYWSSGGILVFFSGAKIENNIIANNQITKSNAWSGGIEVSGGLNDAVIIRNNTITENTINSSGVAGGGGIGFFTKGNVIFENNIVTKNKSIGATVSWGGGVLIDGVYSLFGDIKLDKNYISENEALVSGISNAFGGGIYIRNINPTLTNNIISHNVAEEAGGGIIVWDNSNHPWPTGDPPLLINNTITQNEGGLAGGGISLANSRSHATIINSILWDNSASNYPEIELYSGASVTVRYSDITGGYLGEGNINADPFFTDMTFQLSDSSLCIGAGIDSIQIGGFWYYCPPFCFQGNPRPSTPGMAPDIGACESLLDSPLVGLRPQVLNNLPKSYDLRQNYPNPFNPSTTIAFDLPKTSKVTLKVFNILGEEVVTLVSEKLSAGSYSYEWDASNLASGVYLYRLQAGNNVETRKMVLMR
jgi:hypothetical protein